MNELRGRKITRRYVWKIESDKDGKKQTETEIET